MLAYSVIYGHFSLFVTKNVKKSKKLLKIVNIDWENFHIFLRTSEISMKVLDVTGGLKSNWKPPTSFSR